MDTLFETAHEKKHVSSAREAMVERRRGTIASFPPFFRLTKSRNQELPLRRRDNAERYLSSSKEEDKTSLADKENSVKQNNHQYLKNGYSTYTEKLDISTKIDPSARRVFNLGEKGSGLRARGAVQDYKALRDKCLAEGKLFEDPLFPADDSSLFFSQSSEQPIEWRRPKDIVDNPQLFVEGASRFDVKQGDLGNCWLIAALANLTLSPSLFAQVVPDDQGFEDSYAGIFHFRFWQYGRWVDVVVDDRLPTQDGSLLYMHSVQPNEFWSALFEKAYAKLYGSYEALDAGTTCEAMVDFTGGVSEIFSLKEDSKQIFKIMQKAYERCSLMGCSIEADEFSFEAKTSDGLVKGHAYSVTKVKVVSGPRRSEINLVRLRNPWGNNVEWNGRWSDKSSEWKMISESEKTEIGITIDHDGEFWMCIDDFLKHFDFLEICNLHCDSLEDEITDTCRKKWEMVMFEGEWVPGVTAGGCTNYKETFWSNPQYRISLEDPDEDDDEEFCTIIVALMQKNRRSQRNIGIDNLYIGFTIYELKNSGTLPKPLPSVFFKTNKPVARSPTVINIREICYRFKLPQGVYCIVPSTYEPNEQGEFILRVFSEKKNYMEEIDEKVGMREEYQEIMKLFPETQVDDNVKKFFLTVAGKDQEVDWKELQSIFSSPTKNGKKFSFSKDVCRSMIALMDVDRTGKLGFVEFKTLWVDVQHWMKVFGLYDKDGLGSLDVFELRAALNSAGYSLNNNILRILVHRYGTKAGKLDFDDFVMCAVKLKAVINTFQAKDSKKLNKAEFTLEEWVERVLYS